MSFFYTPYQDFNTFLLIFIRVGVILFILPFFNSKTIPIIAKIGLTFIITILLYPVTTVQMMDLPKSAMGLAQLIVGEIIVAMILGMMVQVLFEGVQIMGQLVGFQTGFSIANVIDPQSGAQVSILSNMAYLMAMVLFLVFNGHHILLNALRESFEIIQIGTLRLNRDLMQGMVNHVAQMFVIGIKIGAPAIAALIFTKIVFGLVTKLIPQMNIMIVAFPLQIIIGLVFFGVSLRLLLVVIEKYVSQLDSLLINTMRWI
jgi:flagellar biosynthesis protein FliR